VINVCHKCEERRLKAARARSQRTGRQATLTLNDWLKTIAAFSGKCAYCMTAEFDTLDHLIPEACPVYGTIAGNCVPACKACNGSKGPSTPGFWSKRFVGARDRIVRVLTECGFSIPDLRDGGSSFARPRKECTSNARRDKETKHG